MEEILWTKKQQKLSGGWKAGWLYWALFCVKKGLLRFLELLCLKRLLKEIAEACRQTEKPLYSWDIADGFVALTENTGRVERPAKDPITALETILRMNQEAVFVLKDFHLLWEKNPQVARKVKNVAQALKQSRKNIIVTSCRALIPEELKDSGAYLRI